MKLPKPISLSCSLKNPGLKHDPTQSEHSRHPVAEVQLAACNAQSVRNSLASIQANKNIGGHASIHVIGHPDRSNDLSKTFWRNAADAQRAARYIESRMAEFDCHEGGSHRAAIGGTPAQVCTQENGNNCITWQNQTRQAICWSVAKNNQQVPIVNTWYPCTLQEGGYNNVPSGPHNNWLHMTQGLA